ncbi:MAG TPA: glycerophosphodiester phosphodiesterase family protein [Candidatus Hydrogenedens sp.]|nr:glycerophosphodiester phosphodiesterase family protein [Candidatus Hydrogenedens sp.]HOL19158.1 glycerophosphodiester phosphodiesterase family protein [Candidatus Hydrogenedens sp.]HPP58800.1 glycerophosphodiester phosphodiesterase family protein [Candidatus Hydrogenedens sp.]
MVETRYLVLLTPMLCLGCATYFVPGAPEGYIDVIAHRGASAYAPENTLASFKKASELGAHWFELDVHLTADNKLVVIHDDELKRVTGVEGKVTEKKWDELKILDAGSWYSPEFKGEHLPSLEQALKLAKKNKIGVYIEIKSSDNDDPIIPLIIMNIHGRDKMTPELKKKLEDIIYGSNSRNVLLAKETIETVRKLKMEKQVVLQTFSPIIFFTAINEAPDLRTEFLGEESEKHPEWWNYYVLFGKLLNAPGMNVSKDSLTQERLNQFHANGQTVAVWTVDKEEEIRKFAEWGVDAIITNKPDVALSILRQMGKTK